MAISKIIADSITDEAVTSAKIATGAVVASDVADGTITNAKIDTVANTKITGLITAAQIATVANTQITGLITAAQIATVANTQITGVITAAQLAATTGSGSVVLATSPTLVTPLLGTPASGTLTNCTGLPVAGGGTGAATLTANTVLIGAGTSAVTFLAPGTTGNVLTSTGSTWLSQVLSVIVPLGEQGVVSIGANSTRALETFTSATGTLYGIHYYTNFTLNQGHTVSVPALKRRLIIIASNTITINGTLTAYGAGAPGGPTSTNSGSQGESGTCQPGGAGYGGALGGYVSNNGYNYGTTRLTGSDLITIGNPLMVMGSGGGGGGNGDGNSGPGTNGGAGGGSIVLIAPTIILASTSVINTAGIAAAAHYYGGSGDGGTGGGGNVYIYTHSYTDNGCTFTLVGTGAPQISAGMLVEGVKQINIY